MPNDARCMNHLRDYSAEEFFGAFMLVSNSHCRVVVKLGPRYDMGNLVPNSNEFKVAASGKDFCVWERTA